MLSKKFLILLSSVIAISAFAVYIYASRSNQNFQPLITTKAPSNSQPTTSIDSQLHPLSITFLRQQEYPGSDITIEETLSPGSNYQRYIASYQSQGLQINALLTVPNGEMPEGGWPVVVFNHGYIPPDEYRTTERYTAYTDGFSRNGYIVFRSDYRGHADSEGEASGAYGSNGYTIDVLNAVASLKKYPQANPEKIGMWGHSLGGYITLRSMVVDPDIKAGVIWAGVVGSYDDLLNNWRNRTYTPPPRPSGTRRWREILQAEYGSPADNPAFWNSLSANSFLEDISGPLQLHHGTNDSSVPVEFSEKLANDLENFDQEVELYTYLGDDHNISANFSTAMNRSVAFFDTYLK